MQEENGMKFKLGGNHRSFPDGNAKKRQTETISKSPPAVSLVTFGVSRGEPAGRVATRHGHARARGVGEGGRVALARGV